MLLKISKSRNCSSVGCLNPVGDSAYERGGDARRLAKGCKFRILVSLKSVLGKTPSYLAVKVSFRVAREKTLSVF